MDNINKYAFRIRVAMQKTQREITVAMQNNSELELTRAQIYILKLIHEDGPCTITHLSKKFGINTSTVSTMVNGFVKDGLVTREYSSNDRRNVFVSITQHGIDVLEQDLINFSYMLEQFLSPLNQDELETFVALFEKIADANT